MTRLFTLLPLLSALLLVLTRSSIRPGSGAAQRLDWASLGTDLRPLLVQQNANLTGQAIVADPSDPSHIAYCAIGGIEATFDGGQSWSMIPIDGAWEAAAGTAFPLVPDGAVSAGCTTLAIDPNTPDGYYATFPAGKAPFGAPPVFYAGYYTTDAGATWQPVPSPDGVDMSRFGGFLVDGQSVYALFGGDSSAPLGPVEQTSDGGVTWTGAALRCPAVGPCVRWGPEPTGIGSCNMTEHPQPVLSSSDEGQNWSSFGLGDVRNGVLPVTSGCRFNELVTLAATRIALLTQAETNALLLSNDAGQTWSPVSLPQMLGESGPSFSQSLQMLPDGSLLAFGQTEASWQLLLPGAAHWCAVADGLLPTFGLPTPRLIGSSLWWLDTAGDQDAPATPRNAPLAELGVDCDAG